MVIGIGIIALVLRGVAGGGSGLDQTRTSGVTITDGIVDSWSTCDSTTKGYLPGASNCKGSVTLNLAKPVASGQVVVVMSYDPSTDSSFVGAAAATTGPVTVQLNDVYIKNCFNNPRLNIKVYDRPLDDPSRALLANENATITESCQGFPAGGLGG